MNYVLQQRLTTRKLKTPTNNEKLILLLLTWLFSTIITTTASNNNNKNIISDFHSQLSLNRDLKFPPIITSTTPTNNNKNFVKLYYLERVLATWILSSSPWNAFHSAIGFEFVDSKLQMFVEYIPQRTDHVKWILHPQFTSTSTSSKPSNNNHEISTTSLWPWWWPNSILTSLTNCWYNNTTDDDFYRLQWYNQGGVHFSETLSQNCWKEEGKFTNFTYIGTLTASQYHKLRTWIFNYQDSHLTFEPVEVFDPIHEITISSSKMCHDMFYQAIYYLVDKLDFKPAVTTTTNKDYYIPIFRDHIVIYAQQIELMYPETNRKDARAITRFYRLFSSFMTKISIEFTAIRGLLITANLLGIEPILYQNNQYYRIKNLVPPYVNYCYMEIVLPPEPRALLSSSITLCALENQMLGVQNLTAYFWENISWQHLRFIFEQSMDKLLL
jgi:hypothetical protein